MAIGIERTAQQEKNQQHLVADYIWETGRQRSQVWIGRWGKQCCCERNYKIKLHGIKEIKIWPIFNMMWIYRLFFKDARWQWKGEKSCNSFFFSKCPSTDECLLFIFIEVRVLMCRGPKSSLKFMQDWPYFMEQNLFHVGPPPKEFSYHHHCL